MRLDYNILGLLVFDLVLRTFVKKNSREQKVEWAKTNYFYAVLLCLWKSHISNLHVILSLSLSLSGARMYMYVYVKKNM